MSLNMMSKCIPSLMGDTIISTTLGKIFTWSESAVRTKFFCLICLPVVRLAVLASPYLLSIPFITNNFPALLLPPYTLPAAPVPPVDAGIYQDKPSSSWLCFLRQESEVIILQSLSRSGYGLEYHHHLLHRYPCTFPIRHPATTIPLYHTNPTKLDFPIQTNCAHILLTPSPITSLLPHLSPSQPL